MNETEERQYLRILARIHEQPWAITDRALETILNIMDRPAADLEAVAARLGRPLENTGNRVEMRGGVAVLNIEGPIFRYANLFTMLSGATSVEIAARDFRQAIDNPLVDQILLNIDSPGGEVGGINEFADQIREGSKVKPVTAYIDGLGASAAYWLAAAAPRVLANESAFIGSIGVVATVTDHRAAQERQGVKRYEIVSSQSPRKRADVATEEGRAQILEMVDAAAELFISRVASFRKATAERVVSDFGGGAVYHARRALAAGMIDGLTSFEAAIQELNKSFGGLQFAATAAREATMETPNQNNAGAAAAATITNIEPAQQQAAAATAERARINGILSCSEASGREGLARFLACETTTDVATAQKMLATAPVNAAAPAPRSPLETAMSQIPNPKVGTGDGAEDDSPAAEAARVLTFVPTERRVKRAG